MPAICPPKRMRARPWKAALRISAGSMESSTSRESAAGGLATVRFTSVRRGLGHADERQPAIAFSRLPGSRTLSRRVEGKGSIVNMGSVVALSPEPRYFATHAYATARARSRVHDRDGVILCGSGIRINAVAPGLVRNANE